MAGLKYGELRNARPAQDGVAERFCTTDFLRLKSYTRAPGRYSEIGKSTCAFGDVLPPKKRHAV